MTDIKILSENVKRKPDDPKAWIDLAEALEALGEHDKALYCRLQVAKLKQKPSQTDKEKVSTKSKRSLFAIGLLLALMGIVLLRIAVQELVPGYPSELMTAAAGSTQIASSWTPTSIPTSTPTPILTLQAAFKEIDQQFQNILKSNIAFNKPDKMKRDETTSVELILSPSLSESALATQLVDQGGFFTSTAEPNVLIAPNGETVTVETSHIDITLRMKAVLLSQDPDAFIIREMHDNAEQVIGSVEITTWRWAVTAKKEGVQTLELVIYQLVKYDGKDFWHEVETYKANIVVNVTVAEWFKSLDWKWILGFTLTFIGSVLGILTWLSNSKKKNEEEKAATTKEEKPVEKRKKVKKRS